MYYPIFVGILEVLKYAKQTYAFFYMLLLFVGYFLYFHGARAGENTRAVFGIRIEWQCAYIITFSYFMFGEHVQPLRLQTVLGMEVKTIFVADKYGCKIFICGI